MVKVSKFFPTYSYSSLVQDPLVYLGIKKTIFNFFFLFAVQNDSYEWYLMKTRPWGRRS